MNNTNIYSWQWLWPLLLFARVSSSNTPAHQPEEGTGELRAVRRRHIPTPDPEPEAEPPKPTPTVLQVLQYLTALGVTIVMLGLMVGAYFTPAYSFPVPGYLILLITLGALIPGGREMVLAVITAILKRWS